MDSLDFTDDEIKRQLAALGYLNVTEDRMKQFKRDLYKLIEHDRSMSGSSSWFTGVSSPSSNSDFSESDRNKTSGSSRPMSLSRFQPHLKVQGKPTNTDSSDSFQQDPVMPKQHYHPMPTSPKKKDFTETSSRNFNETDYNRVSQMSSLPIPPEARTKTTVMSSSNFTTDATPDMSDSETPVSTPPTQGKVIRKRKVLRKESDGTPRVYDESLIEDRAGLYRMHNLSVDDSDPRLMRTREPLSLPPRPHTARPSWKKDSNFEAFVSPDQPPSYIRPNTSHPHTRNLRKVDPVNRYHQYKDFWTNIKAPGEKSHKSLRWEVKAQMMYKEEPAPKPQRVYVPNSYVVPTSKKRSALRWEVRHAMERGLPVPTAFDVY